MSPGALRKNSDLYATTNITEQIKAMIKVQNSLRIYVIRARTVFFGLVLKLIFFGLVLKLIFS